MVGNNNSLSLESLVQRNSEMLGSIMGEGEMTLLDANVILDIGTRAVLSYIPPFDYIDIDSLEQCGLYLKNILNHINSNPSVSTVSEVIDNIFPAHAIIRRKIKFIKGAVSKGMIKVKEDKEKINLIKSIGDYVKNLKNVLDRRVRIFNPGIYGEFKSFVNEIYNKYKKKEKKDKDEPVCADDGLIAGSLMLLMGLQKPIRIISNDVGVTTRLRILGSLIFELKNYNFELKNYNSLIYDLYILLNSTGISIYSSLNDSSVYRLYGTTRKRGLRYHLCGDKSGELKDYSDSLEGMIKKTYPLEQ